MKKLVLATRKSPLALAQAGFVAARLRDILGSETELLKVVTTGDKQTNWSLEKSGGKGLFTAELEQSLLRGEADVAVHSAKDLPGEMTPQLIIAGYLPREDPRDVLIVRADVEKPRTIATGSPRRRGQLMALFPGAQFCEIRGNVDTRLKKIAEQRAADATVLAAAGLKRLGIAGWPGLEFRFLPLDQMIPAVGQGAIAVQCRAAAAARFASIFDAATARAVAVERAFQRKIGAGCQTAFAAHVTADMLYLFHEKIGRRSLSLAPADFTAPEETAARILKNFALL
ncbi:MAG: hydroxymethylbilane synthase [Verrucomicrobiota bacterium]|nr:hydroxymethylbilane synthase [Verrucomicrobiota bacterium]